MLQPHDAIDRAGAVNLRQKVEIIMAHIIMRNCVECGDVFPASKMLSGPQKSAYYYCEDCYHSVLAPCEDCGEAIIPGTGVHYAAEGYYLCDNCLGVK